MTCSCSLSKATFKDDALTFSFPSCCCCFFGIVSSSLNADTTGKDVVLCVWELDCAVTGCTGKGKGKGKGKDMGTVTQGAVSLSSGPLTQRLFLRGWAAV